MKKELQRIQHILRNVHLLKTVDYFRYMGSILRNRKSNRAFLKNHPDFALPPQHLAYDAYSAPNWEYYYRSGIQVAQGLTKLLKKYNGDISHIKVLEWGCGPARIIRHLPSFLGSMAEIYGTDYNFETIQWAKDHINGISGFYKNDLLPPLPFDNDTFDFVYAMSVFTHLSEESCLTWIVEITRVLKDDGTLLFTTNSDNLLKYLLPHEKELYETKGFVQRDNVQEGKKMFGAYHARWYVKRTMLKNFDLLEHITSGSFQYGNTQDIWLVRKKKLKLTNGPT